MSRDTFLDAAPRLWYPGASRSSLGLKSILKMPGLDLDFSDLGNSGGHMNQSNR